MKKLISPVLLLAFIQLPGIHSVTPAAVASVQPSQNLFIITIDGFRWQEIFNGADAGILNDQQFTPDQQTMKMLYWANSPEERRKKLMPFFWNVIASQGQLYGNRQYDNKVDADNLYALSYPGYNELFTGYPDTRISSNRKKNNPNRNVLEYLNALPDFTNKVAAFSSWDVFPYILNSERNHLPVNSGYTAMEKEQSVNQQMINAVQSGINDKEATRYDELTFLTAKEYIAQRHPRVIFLGLGETDEFAHKGRYDLYLQQATAVDRMIAELWHWVQTTPGYKDHTSFLITTDHGRGAKAKRWTSHGEFIKGSAQTWYALLGPGILPAGEIKKDQQQYLLQAAPTIAYLLGEEFITQTAAAAFSVNETVHTATSQ